MKIIIAVVIIILLSVLGLFLITQDGKKTSNVGDFEKPTESWKETDNSPITDPLNAKYIIDGTVVSLKNGYSETEIVSGTYRKVVTKNFGEPKYGDLDGDGDEDAVLLLTQNLGGSGTFYFLAVAINERGEYRGTETVFLGDRISSQTLEVKNSMIIVSYVDHRSGEAMIVRPSSRKSKGFFLREGALEERVSTEEGESIFFGHWVYGHEVRSFTPCGRNKSEYWVMGDSSAMSNLKETYLGLMSDATMSTSSPVATSTPTPIPTSVSTSTPVATSTPTVTPVPEFIVSAYTPLFVVVVGKIVDAPVDGFGANYDYGIEVRSLVFASSTEECI